MADGMDDLAHLFQIGPAARADRQVRFELGLLAQREAVLEILGHQFHQFFAAEVVRTSHAVPLTCR
jgi:hypothetical protein